jgi:hypothetical protein
VFACRSAGFPYCCSPPPWSPPTPRCRSVTTCRRCSAGPVATWARATAT